MEKEPPKVKKVPSASQKPAAFVALAVALAVNAVLFAVLLAIKYPEIFYMPAGELSIEFVPQQEQEANPEEAPAEEQEAEQKVELVKIPVEFETPITSNEDPLAVTMPEWNPELYEMPEEEFELLPEEIEDVRFIVIEEKRKPVRKKPVSPPTGPANKDENIVPDKKVRYKHAPSLPASVNSSKVGRVKALVKVAVNVTVEGTPASVSIVQSTGNAELDRLFVRWVKENWTFYPAEKDGKPIASKVVVPVRLNID